MSSIEIPKVGKAAVVVNRGPNFSVETREDYPVPTPGPGELLLRLNACGICLSDIHLMSADWGVGMAPDISCSGHEGAGVVVAVGENVDPGQWKVGDRAGVKPIMEVCQSCDLCRNGMEVHCDKAVSTGASKDGTYCQYILSPASYTTHIPEGVPDEIAAPTMCSGGTIYKALKVSGARAGQWVVVPGGGGGVGHQAIQYGKVMGLRIIAIDTGKDKEEMCLSLGAEAFIDFKTSPDVLAEVKKLTGSGAQAVIVTGGTAAAYATAPNFLRKGGTQVCVGLPTAGTCVAGADPFQLIFQKLTIVGSLVGSLLDVDEALDLTARGLVKPKITVLPFKDFPTAVQNLKEGKVAGRQVVKFDL